MDMRLFEITNSLPTITFQELFHVGTMNAEHKSLGSFEGSGLSVSTHPEAWATILKTGNDPVWKCTKNDNKFIDFHKLSKRNKDVIAEWAFRNGFASVSRAWKVEYYDDEEEQTRYFTFYDEEKAKQQAEMMDTTPIEISGGNIVSTPKLALRMMQHTHGVESMDLVVVVYAEDAMKYDGVWWSDKLKVSNLSAPRGVVVPSMIKTWKFEKVQ
jgi:hypothetical protein